MTSSHKIIEGRMEATNLSFAVLAARFNDFIVERLIGGAVDYLLRHGADPSRITIIRVPGAYEMPLVCQKLAKSGDYDAIVALGAVIRGATPHFDFVATEATKGLAQVQLSTGIPVGFGLLTTDTLDQAIERAGSKAGNKGAEAALTAIEMINLFKQI